MRRGGRGEQFLHQRDSKLHTTPKVEHEKARKKVAGEKVSQKPADKIADFLGVIEQTHLGHRDDERVQERIKKDYHNRLVIKPEDVPESYFKLQQKIAEEQGHGHIEITDEMRKQHIEVIVADQQSSLDTWLDYFTSEDSDSFPMWAKYWAFTGMNKLSSFNKEKQQFGKRKKDTTAPYPDLNREALAYVVDAITKKVNKQDLPAVLDNPEFKQLLAGANFGKLYAWAIEKVTPAEEHELLTTSGEWKTYDQGSDHMPLVESLQGHGTGWCTAGESTAKSQLQQGGFHVYYSHAKDGSPTVPRVAIRMQGNNIAEVRGIAANQNVDNYIADTEIVGDKLSEFGSEGESYLKKDTDMKRVTEIDKRVKQGEELTKEDLRFLYEIDSKINGFGYQKDPRVNELLEERNSKKDLALLFDCHLDQISINREEALSGNIVFHYGALDLRSVTQLEAGVLPERIGGDLNLSSVTQLEAGAITGEVGGDLNLSNVTQLEAGAITGEVGGNLNLSSVTQLEAGAITGEVGGTLNLISVTQLEAGAITGEVGGDLNLSSVTQLEAGVLPERIGGTLQIRSVTQLEAGAITGEVGGDLNLSSVTQLEAGAITGEVGGNLYLRSVTQLEAGAIPERIGGVVFLRYKNFSAEERNSILESNSNLTIKFN